jgi:putative DNA primase/helicase
MGNPFEDQSVDVAKADAPETEVFPPPFDPLAVARHLIEVDGLHHPDGTLTVRWWRGSFYLWTGTHWNEIAATAVRARTYHALEHARFRKVNGDDEKELVPWSPTRRKVGDVLEALQAVAHLDEQVEPPAWVDGDGDDRLLALRNGLLHLSTRRLESHSPRLFNLLALPYDYDAKAPEPAQWLAFLKELFAEDPDSIALLQEWFGYVLSGSTAQHKILLLIGPPRSGKGTIARVLAALIGKDNTAGPTLASLGTNFGLSPLLGKSLAVISDARLGGPNTFTVVERLLSISGEDAITVDRKYKDPWTGRLGARFMVISNELPDLGDASGAIASRFATLVLTTSWLGKEDHGLTEELLAELPGILWWALQGLDRLERQGYFTEPTSSRDAATALLDMASPTGAFVRDRCQVGPTYEVPMKELYAAWRAWCEVNGQERPGTAQMFGRNLRAAAPTIRTIQPRTGGDQRERRYAGIRISSGESATRNGVDHVPSRASDSSDGPERDGTRSEPMWAAPESNAQRSWRCQRCDHETTYRVVASYPHTNCGGLFAPVEPQEAQR